MPLSADLPPKSSLTLILLATSGFQGVSDIRSVVTSSVSGPVLVREVQSSPKEVPRTFRGLCGGFHQIHARRARSTVCVTARRCTSQGHQVRDDATWSRSVLLLRSGPANRSEGGTLLFFQRVNTFSEATAIYSCSTREYQGEQEATCKPMLSV